VFDYLLFIFIILYNKTGMSRLKVSVYFFHALSIFYLSHVVD